MRIPLAGLALFTLGISLSTGQAQESRSADLILHNGEIWTGSPDQPSAQAVAVLDGRLLAVGANPEVLRLRSAETKVIDLEGAFVVPGFNDTHVHVQSAAQFLEFNIMQAGTQEEFVARVRDVVSRLEPGDWILGGLWGAYDEWSAGSAGSEKREPFRPDMRLVESMTKENPVFIQKFDNSEFAANHAALRRLNIDPEKPPSVRGVEFLRDDEGYTGVFRGPGARALFQAKIPRRFTMARRVSQTQHALAIAARSGVTSLSDMSDEEQLQIYRDLQAEGKLTLRVDYRYPLDSWPELKERGIKAGSGDEWIRLGGLKGHIDGIMGTSSARFYEPYSHDPENRGRWRRLMVDEKGEFVEGQFLGHMLSADEAGLQMSVHAIGDEANGLLLDYLEELNRQNGMRDRRFRLVHAQVIAPSDFARLGPLGILAEVQPYHLSDDMRWMEERIGHERCKTAYAFESIAEAGAVLCFGSDWPGTSAASYPINPMLGIYAAVSRQTIRGEPEEGWFPEQRISVERALRAYTYGGAYSTFEEDSKGTLEVGKLADLVVLSKNILECAVPDILAAEVEVTIVGGRIVYEK
ncbi:MAG: amidohydrolase [Planctomycetota bacterium]|jgi:predicted amidohydrolase YtcJ